MRTIKDNNRRKIRWSILCICTLLFCLANSPISARLKEKLPITSHSKTPKKIVFVGFELSAPAQGVVKARLYKKRVVSGTLKPQWPCRISRPKQGDLRLQAFDTNHKMVHVQYKENPMHQHREAPVGNNELKGTFHFEPNKNVWFRFAKPSQARYGLLEYFDKSLNKYMELYSFDLTEEAEIDELVLL